MKYRIGEVERILGVSTDTIRFFERKGIVKPYKDTTNNYRYYNSMDIHKLVAYKYYRNMDFSADEAVNMLSYYSHKESLEKLENQIVVIEKKLEHYNELYERMQELKKSYYRVNSLVNDFEIVICPDLIFYNNQVNHEFDRQEVEEKRQITQKWLNNLPFVWLAFNIPFEDIPSGTRVFWGYAIETSQQSRINSLDMSYTKLLPAQRCLHTVLKCTNEEILKPTCLKPALSYIKAQRLQIAGDAVGWIINEERDAEGSTRYFEIWIPIK